MVQRFRVTKHMETNEGRAEAARLKQAPILAGYFYRWKDCVENLGINLERTRAGEGPRVKQLFLETANVCDFKCPMCYTDAEYADGKGTERIARTGFAEWKAAIAAAKAAGVENVAIAGCGEPLLDPNFWRLLEHVREQELDLLVFTNGAHIDAETAKRLKLLCNSVVTKFFAMDPEAHDVLVGVKGEYVKVRAALAHLLDAGLRAPNLGIDLVIAKQNVLELENILRVCRMLGVVPYFERLARVGRAAKLNGNMVLPEAEVDEAFARLRAVDEKEFGFAWGIAPGMAALANAETDKRMVAVHLDVFGNVQPGLATGHVIGNIRDADGGMAGILGNAHAWAEYYGKVAEEVGLEEEPGAKIPRQRKTYPYREVLEQAADDARALCVAHTEKCGEAGKEGAVPDGVRRMVEGLAAELEGTGYENAFAKIRAMVLEENLYIRATGELLLMEMVYGRRHLDHCDRCDLVRLEWEAGGVRTHLAKDHVWNAFMKHGGFAPIDNDRIILCAEFKDALLRQFTAEGLEFAAVGLVKWMVPGEDCGHEKCRERNAESARRFGETLGARRDVVMPTLLDLACEHAGGGRDIPRNEAFFQNAKDAAFAQLEAMKDGLEKANPAAWLRENAACTFVGSNDLAALAGFLYHGAQAAGDAEKAELALDVIRLLGKDPVLRGKMMRKRSVPKVSW